MNLHSEASSRPDTLTLSELIESLQTARYEAGTDAQTGVVAAYWDGAAVVLELPAEHHLKLSSLDKAPNNSAQVLQDAAPKTVAVLVASAGDGGLREALDEALTTVEQGIAKSTKPDREGFLMTSHVRQILAAHPAVPAVLQPVDREALERIRAYLAVAPNWDELAQAWDQDAGVPRKILASDLRTLLAVLAGEQDQEVRS